MMQLLTTWSTSALFSCLYARSLALDRRHLVKNHSGIDIFPVISIIIFIINSLCYRQQK